MQNSRYRLIIVALVILLCALVAYFLFAPKTTELTVQPQTPNSVAEPVQSETTLSPQASEPALADKPANPELKSETLPAEPEIAPQPAEQLTQPSPQQASPQVPTDTNAQAKIQDKTSRITAEQEVSVPVFDVLRLEADGSLVIAGKAAPQALVDVIAKSRVLGSVQATDNGDFVIVLNEALKPGDYQLVLRATTEDQSVATSRQTAILSVPETADGQVLALVEEPGQASRMITTPQAQKSDASAVVPQKDITTSQHGMAENTQLPAPDKAPEKTTQAETEVAIAVEAVEIEGQTVFVAGHANRGHSVAVSANKILLGTALVTPEGRYLVQSAQPLAVGDYIISADLLSESGHVLATARVPFRREEGANIAAVAPKTSPAQMPVSPEQRMNATDAPALEKAEGSVIIRKGDNLWTISKRTYGDGMRYTTIYLANTDQIKNPDLIWPGQVFVMPKQPLSDEEVKNKLH